MLFNPLKDHIKGQIDYCFLEIVKNFNCILFGTISMSDALSKVNEFLSLEENDLNEKVDIGNVFMGFFAYNDFSVTKAKLENLLNIILTSSKFEDFWAAAVIELLDWLRLYVFLLDGRKGKLYEVSPLPNKKYDIISSNSLNTRNPENSYILLKRASGKGQVVNISCLRTMNKSYMLSPHFIRNDMKDSYIGCIIRLIKICTTWLMATGSEFILDPEYYYIT